MIIDLQMTTDHFLHGVRNELRSQSVCFTKEVTVDNKTLLLDHVEVSDKTSIKRIPQHINVQGHEKAPPHPIEGSAVYVTQEILLHFTSLQALTAAAPVLPDTAPGLSVTIHFVLTLALDPLGHPLMHVEYLPQADAGTLGFIVNDAGQQIDKALSGINLSVPIDMRSLAAVGVGLLRFANSGLVVDDSGAIVTIRLEDGTDPDSVGAWTAFFAGGTSSLLNGMQWGIFIDSRLMTGVALGLFNAAVPKGGIFQASGPASATWSANGHGVHVSQSGVMPKAGPLSTDVDVTFDADLDFLLPSADDLIFRLTLAATGSGGGLIGAALDFIGVNFDPAPELPSLQGWTKVDDLVYEHKEALFIGNSLLGHLIVAQLVADGNGLHLVGSASAPLPVTPAALLITIKPFDWALQGSCNKGYRITSGGYLGLNNAGIGPLTVCDARILFDPDGQFPIKVETASSQSSEFEFIIRVDFTNCNPHTRRDRINIRARLYSRPRVARGSCLWEFRAL